MEVSLVTADGKDANALAQLIDLRRKELGETTAQACKALMQNVLRSLRAETLVANPNEMNIKVVLAPDYTPSWKRDPGSKKSVRILRAGANGAEIKPERVVWNCGKYQKGEILYAFFVTDEIAPEKKFQYVVVSKDQKSAEKYAKDRHKRIVKNHRGLAKLALGLAMQKLYNGENPTDKVSDKTRELAGKNYSVDVREEGFNSGSVSIQVHDKLDYAELALKGGPSSVQTAL